MIFGRTAVTDANGNTTGYTVKSYGYYTYDAWGNVTAHTATGSTPASTSLIYRNPLRYRGYIYDNETGFYYLQSRYYDPANHRFINADVFTSTEINSALASNMFAYCENNPVLRKDESGNIFNTIFGAIVGGITAVLTREEGESFGDALVRGVTTGALSGAAVDLSLATGGAAAVVIAVGGGALASGIDSAWEDKNNGREVSYGKAFINAGIGGVVNGLFAAAGRSAKNVVGQSLKSVGKAVLTNTVRSVTSKSGQFLVKKFVTTLATNTASALAQGVIGKTSSLIVSNIREVLQK